MKSILSFSLVFSEMSGDSRILWKGVLGGSYFLMIFEPTRSFAISLVEGTKRFIKSLHSEE